MTSNPEFGNVTGTRDKDYDIIWFTEACLSNVLRLETYIEDAALAGDDELADFFRPGAAREPERCRGGEEVTGSALNEVEANRDTHRRESRCPSQASRISIWPTPDREWDSDAADKRVREVGRRGR